MPQILLIRDDENKMFFLILENWLQEFQHLNKYHLNIHKTFIIILYMRPPSLHQGSKETEARTDVSCT